MVILNVLKIYKTSGTKSISNTVSFFELNKAFKEHIKKEVSKENTCILSKMINEKGDGTEIQINEILLHIFFQWKLKLVEAIHTFKQIEQTDNEIDRSICEKRWGNIRTTIDRNFPAAWRNNANAIRSSCDHPLDPHLHTPRAMLAGKV